ncbi:MAG TPA: 50S ribosomal protein L21 [Anaerolineales bacterium]
MRYAIIESGGKQYRAVEGQTIEVDRLSDEAGAQIDLRALLMADGDDFMVGTPTVGGVQVKATVLNHFRGEKAVRFKYSPKKRIRVRGGHRQQYTRLSIDFIGRPGEERKVEKVDEFHEEPEAEAKVDAPVKAPAKKAAVKRSAAKKAPAKKAAVKSATKKSSK